MARRALGLLLALCAAAAAAPGADLLAGAGPLALWPDLFDDDALPCTAAEVLRAEYDAFALPAPAPDGSIEVLLEAAVACGASAPRATLLALGGGAELVVDCLAGDLRVEAGGDAGALAFALPPGALGARGARGAPPPLRLGLAVDAGAVAPGVRVCVNGAPLLAAASDGAPGAAARLLALARGGGLLAEGVALGGRAGGARPAARVDFDRLWLLPGDGAGPGAAALCAPDWPALEDGARADAPPALAPLAQEPPGDAAVEAPVRFRAAAADAAAGALRLSLTFFGVPLPGCAAAECGDYSVEAAVGYGGAAELEASVAFPLPGRYAVRAAAADGSGAVAVRDHFIVVRKRGDTGAAAPCCRHAALVVAQALGRPAERLAFRPPRVYAHAAALGWPRSYVDGADLEAERLFDYSSLAPDAAAEARPLRALRCADARLAGAGSPRAHGLRDALAGVTRGHGKALALVPAGFPWAAPEEVECQRHWSGWHAEGPGARPGAANGTCAVSCSRAGTELLVAAAAMADQLGQALIEASYGQLSLAPHPLILPEVAIPREAPEGTDDFAYYEAPARAALAAAGARPWLWLVLAPLARHRRPPHRAWSGGIAAGGAIITRCFATMYYALHETGHRLGFPHARVRVLDAHHAAPADPLGPGGAGADAYVDRLDAMSCCRGDFGLWHRSLAGWVHGGGRLVLGAAELAEPSERRVLLWPFDRAESRGRLVGLALRRAPGEVVLLGLRAAAHWPEGGGGDGAAPPAEARQNVAGLQAEFAARGADGAWADKQLLDFNALTGDWPDALAPAAGAPPREAAHALLKEGGAWHDAGAGTLVAFERLGPCDAPPALAPAPHAPRGFFGLRGDWPFRERLAPADFEGHAALQCAHLVVRTRAPPPPPARLEAAAEAACARAGGLALRVGWAEGERVAAVVWRDARNRTLAAGPPEAGAVGAALPRAPALPVSAHLLAADGRQTRVTFSAAPGRGGRVRASLKFYGPAALEFREQALAPALCGGARRAVGALAGFGGLALACALAAALALWALARARRRRWRQAEPEAPAAGGAAAAGAPAPVA